MSSIPTASFSKWSDTDVLSTATPRRGESDQFGSLLNQIANGEPNCVDDPVNRRRHRVLHLHRFDDHQGLATPHSIAGLDQQLSNPSRHRGGQAAGPRIIAFPRGKRIDLDQPPVFAGEKYHGFKAVIEHGGAAVDTVEHYGQGAIGAALASSADRFPVDLQLPFSGSSGGGDNPLPH